MTALAPPPRRVIEITPRQRLVIEELCCDGAENKEIAARLGVSPDAVKHHLQAVLTAGGYPNRTAMAVDLLRGNTRLRVVPRRTGRTPS